ncbi:hypothetical protein [Thermomonas carbonis]|uniref:Uncharacterized protein n=1 Tax=Thermomonas carbonis TaxID=1463158 RepID=A0A7G9SNH4_9GAMM|nr:hypothetical protein [Thermomonas carbonis]QNN69399.1 hypothetical protein H9L16_12040 [Thermomonas carbonis]GHC12685.1 hypothetical protein GCM10010080_30310 [Thermomonas carbonis]
MPDLASIASALSSLKVATDIVKFIRESDVSLERAELKLKLADLVGTLAEAKIQLSEIQTLLAEKDLEISRLTDAIETKDKVVRHLDAMYFQDDQGKAIGSPHCLGCWNDKHKLRLLAEAPVEHGIHICTSCHHKYQRRLTPREASPTA